jgi:hypothetical protein
MESITGGNTPKYQERTAAFTDRLRGDCTGAETAIGKYAFRTVSGQPSDGAQGIGDFAE